jgi:NADH dehydrogenase (ubiquinone) 1 alpha subcomplex subunit 5
LYVYAFVQLFFLTGLKVLIAIYNKTLKALSQLPSHAAYRQHTEQITKERLEIVTQEQEVDKIEAKLQAGLIEEVIKQAEVELTLVAKMKEWMPWEPLVGKAPPTQWQWP